MGETAQKCYVNEEKGDIVDCIDPNTDTYKHDCTKCSRYTHEVIKSEATKPESTPDETKEPEPRYMTKRQYAFERTALLGFGLALLSFGFQVFQSHYAQRDMSAYLGMAGGIFWAICGLVCWGLYVYLATDGGRHDKDLIRFMSSKECKVLKEIAAKALEDTAGIKVDDKKEK